MKQSLELKLGQRLTMTPQLQQAIKLLQLSAIDLKTEIQQALEENPLLEEDHAPDNADIDVVDRDEIYQEPLQREEQREEADFDNDDNAAAAEESEFTQWSEHFESHITGIRNDSSSLEIEDRSSNPTTLKDHLLWQMRMIPFTEADQEIAIALIDAVNEDGYLTVGVEDVIAILDEEDLHVDASEVEATLHQIQNFDPIGVGARDLRECLLIQLRQFDRDLEQIKHAKTLLSDHFDLLSTRSLAQIRRLMKIDETTLNDTIKFIQNLHPRPGNAITPAVPSYIIPDIIVKKIKNEWRAELNREAFPRPRISNTYQALLGRKNNGNDRKYLQNHLQEARWFMKSLDQRDETLLKVARSIIERQREFFELGEQAMKPMVLHDIADTLNLHESTISRATTQKYMLTPRGIFELKYFFSSHVSTADGGTCSSTVIRNLIKQYVDNESPTSPISDSKMAKLLGQQGINVARRTIAKYRENMNIPASSQRKAIV